LAAAVPQVTPPPAAQITPISIIAIQNPAPGQRVMAGGAVVFEVR